MSDAGGGKKPPVEPQAGPGPGRAAGERGLSGSFPLVLKKLMENPPRETRLGEGGGGGGSRVSGGGVSARAGPCGGGAGLVRGQGEVVQRRRAMRVRRWLGPCWTRPGVEREIQGPVWKGQVNGTLQGSSHLDRAPAGLPASKSLGSRLPKMPVPGPHTVSGSWDQKLVL